MEGKPHDYMRVGIIHFMVYPQVMGGEGPILETAERLLDDEYFDVIEVTQIGDRQTRAAVARAARERGKGMSFGAQPILLGGKLNLNVCDETERAKAVAAVKRGIDQAYDLGALGTAVLSGVDPGPELRETERALLVDSLKELCAYSQSKGDKPVVLETFDRQPFGKNCLIGPTDEAVAVAERVREAYPSFGLMIDLSHLPLLNETAEESLKTARSYLRHIHIGNCVMREPGHPAYGDNHPMFGIEEGENGEGELTEFLRVLLEIGYVGRGGHNIVSFELKPFGQQSAEEIIENGKQTLDAAWQAL